MLFYGLFYGLFWAYWVPFWGVFRVLGPHFCCSGGLKGLFCLSLDLPGSWEHILGLLGTF